MIDFAEGAVARVSAEAKELPVQDLAVVRLAKITIVHFRVPAIDFGLFVTVHKHEAKEPVVGAVLVVEVSVVLKNCEVCILAARGHIASLPSIFKEVENVISN